MIERLYKTVSNILDKDKVVAYLDTLSLSNRKLTTVAIVMLIKDNTDIYDKDLLDFYGKLARDARNEDTIQRINRPATEQELESFIDWNDIIKLRETYNKKKNNNDRDYMKYITLCLFTMLPPQRGQVFYNCYIDKDVEGSNILDIDKKILIIREYKTKRIYGTIELPLTDELIDIIKEWKLYKKKGDGRLIYNIKGETMSTSVFTAFMYSIFNSNISTDMLRKIYISHKISEGIDIKERQKLSEEMGHSVFLQEFIYNKKDFQ